MSASPIETKPSICRFCHASCAILVDIQDGKAIEVRGDRDNPIYGGFTCPKGRQLPQQHSHPDRLLYSMKRDGSGNHQPLASEQAMDEVAAKIQAIVQQHGPRSVAIYIGTYSGPYLASIPTAIGWLLSLGSRMIFTSSTIDQPGKSIANSIHGRWLAGSYVYDESDCWLGVGVNPLVSVSGGLSVDPGRTVREAKKRGQKLLVIDPRRTELARFADLFIQPKPGEDPTIIAALIHVVIGEGLYDQAFVDANTQGFTELATAVRSFSPDYAAKRADVSAQDLRMAARLYATANKAGAVAGTGPNMAGRGNLTEYLILCLSSLCGHWRRAGEAVANPGVMLPGAIPVAQAESPRKAWGYGEKLRVRDFTGAACGLPTSALADEILQEGDGQIRALICLGSNPIAAWPDQLKTIEAMKKLDLLVCLDIKMAATAKLADYVIAPKLSLEVPGASTQIETLEQTYVSMGYAQAYGQYSPALVDPPSDSDLIEEWEFFYGLGQRMGQQITLYPINAETGMQREPRKPIKLDMVDKPDSDEVLELLHRGSRIPLEHVKRHAHGAVFSQPEIEAAPKQQGWEGYLDLANKFMLDELHEVSGEPITRAIDTPFPFRLISRRLPNVYNSSGRDLHKLMFKHRYNPAFMHPDDMNAYGLSNGEVIRISSDHASIFGIVEEEEGLREGVISMAHCFGDVPQQDQKVHTIGSNTGRLIPVDRNYDPYSGIPRMSALPVRIERASITPED
ncbi:MAG: molybdopterin-dependent oxidoreductase [Halieaceae bacterium]|jgi:anaerobic selenocysteine-containing dehydrogenase|nr:molybdopterin-dependent oxidoreductase [Halieaceae bacterium]